MALKTMKVGQALTLDIIIFLEKYFPAGGRAKNFPHTADIRLHLRPKFSTHSYNRYKATLIYPLNS